MLKRPYNGKYYHLGYRATKPKVIESMALVAQSAWASGAQTLGP